MPRPVTGSVYKTRKDRILAAAESVGHITEYFQLAGHCSLAEATVELMRLEREGFIRRGYNAGHTTWKLWED